MAGTQQPTPGQLASAFEENHLEVWYQPQVDARTGVVVGLEALARWRRPGHGVLAPAAFLDGIRAAGLMPALTDMVVARALADLADWRGPAERVRRVSVNFDPASLRSSELRRQVRQRLDESGHAGAALTVEVTEDSFVGEGGDAREAIDDLKQAGIQVAVDNYGTGFASLKTVCDLAVDELKIDRSLVAGVHSDVRRRDSVRSTTTLARQLGLRVVAEGVQDRETADLLARMGVDVLQGYYLSRPMPSCQVAAWLASR